MQALLLVLSLLALTVGAYALGRGRAHASAPAVRLHSLPGHYGLYVAAWCALPALLVLGVWTVAGPAVVEALVMADLPEHIAALSSQERALLMTSVRGVAVGGLVLPGGDPEVARLAARYREIQALGFRSVAALVLATAAGGLVWARAKIAPRFQARPAIERLGTWILFASSTVAVLTTVGIVLSLLFESLRFFQLVPVSEFLFGTHWSPQTALRADQTGASGTFGAVPLLAGTLLITTVALLVSVPVGLMAAIYTSTYADPAARAAIKPALEILAGVPTVVYGFFAALSVAPLIRGAGEALGLDVASESALAAGTVMGVMMIPLVSSLCDDVITAVPQSLSEGSLAMGATTSETVRRVLLPAALPGIFGAFLLAASRAIGETMIVVMAAGLAANLTANPLEAVTTVTVQIVTLLVGDQEFDSAKTLAAFALGLLLFLITLALNVVALRLVRKYREAYE